MNNRDEFAFLIACIACAISLAAFTLAVIL